MKIDRLNLNQIRILDSVFKTRSMEKSARELHLTREGVRQHVQSLEENLGIELFLWGESRMQPTAECEFLFRKCSESLSLIEMAIEKVTNSNEKRRREIRAGVVGSCNVDILKYLHYPSLKLLKCSSIEVISESRNKLSEKFKEGGIDYLFDLNMGMGHDVGSLFHRLTSVGFTLNLDFEGDPREWSVSKKKRVFGSRRYVIFKDEKDLLTLWFQKILGMPFNFPTLAYIEDRNIYNSIVAERMGTGLCSFEVNKNKPAMGSTNSDLCLQLPFGCYVSRMARQEILEGSNCRRSQKYGDVSDNVVHFCDLEKNALH